MDANQFSVLSVADLETFARRLDQFTTLAPGWINEITGAFGRVLDEVRYREGWWAGQAIRLQADLDQARDERSTCLADPEADCDQEVDRVRWLERELGEAEESRDVDARLARELSHRLAMLRTATNAAMTILTERGGWGVSAMTGALSEIDRHRHLRSRLDGAPGPSRGITVSSGANQRTAAGGTSGSGARPAAAAAGGPIAFPPPPSGSAFLPSGFAYIPIAAVIPDEYAAIDEHSFQKMPLPEMKIALATLVQTIIPLVQQGADGDHFRQLDETALRPYEHGLQRVYDLFFGQDSIVAERDGPHYRLTGGRHRVWLAAQLGLPVLPARILGATP